MNKLKYIIISLIPQIFFCNFIKFITELEKPKFLVSFLKIIFVKLYKIDLSDSEFNIEKYSSVQKLFCRKIINRKIENGIISPVDGFISQCNEIKNNTLIQAKGLEYTLDKLIPKDKIRDYENGWFTTIYLAPYNYHRIHSIFDGKISEFYYNPGKFWPVNNITVPNLKNLFKINERVTSFLKTELGNIAIIKVAALGVGNIPISYINTNFYKKKNPYKVGYNNINEINIKKGEEIGAFTFGSTVILLFDKSFKKPDFNSLKNKKIKFGETILNI